MCYMGTGLGSTFYKCIAILNDTPVIVITRYSHSSLEIKSEEKVIITPDYDDDNWKDISEAVEFCMRENIDKDKEIINNE